MLLDTQFDPLNSFWAYLLIKGHPNLLDFYKFNCRKSHNSKIRGLANRSGNRQIEIRQLPDQNQTAA